MGHRLGQDRGLEAQRLEQAAADIGEAVADVALALRADRRIDGQHQRAEPGIGRALDQVGVDRRVARGIELIPVVLRRDLGRRLDRVVAGARHDVRDVRVARRLGQHQIGMVAEQPRPAGRRDAERAREGLAENRLCLVALRHVDEIARQQLVLVKGRGVGFEAALVLEPALDEVESDLRQPPLRHAVQVFDIDGLIDPHGSFSPNRRPVDRVSLEDRALSRIRQLVVRARGGSAAADGAIA